MIYVIFYRIDEDSLDVIENEMENLSKVILR
jgi:hypothetical protein